MKNIALNVSQLLLLKKINEQRFEKLELGLPRLNNLLNNLFKYFQLNF